MRRRRPVHDADRAARLRPPRRAHHPAGRPAGAGAGPLAPDRSARRRPGRTGRLGDRSTPPPGSLAFGTTVARYFDIVGMDPRGVGQSTPLQCLDTSRRTRSSPPTRRRTPRPRSPGLDRVDRAARRGAAWPSDRGLTEHISTDRGGQGHGHPAGRARGAAAGLPRGVVRHASRRHVRQPLPRARRPDGARRRGRPRAEQRAARLWGRHAASRPLWTPSSRTASATAAAHWATTSRPRSTGSASCSSRSTSTRCPLGTDRKLTEGLAIGRHRRIRSTRGSSGRAYVTRCSRRSSTATEVSCWSWPTPTTTADRTASPTTAPTRCTP